MKSRDKCAVQYIHQYFNQSQKVTYIMKEKHAYEQKQLINKHQK